MSMQLKLANGIIYSLAAGLLLYEYSLYVGLEVWEPVFWTLIIGVVLLFTWLPVIDSKLLGINAFLLGSVLASMPLLRFGNFFGTDVYWEYTYFTNTLRTAHWLPSFNFYATSFSDTITPTMLTEVTGFRPGFSFEVYATLLMGSVTLLAFAFFSKILNRRSARVSFILFVFASSLVTNPSVKQLTGILMLELWLMVLFSKSKRLNLFLPLFILATIQAHPLYFLIGIVLTLGMLISDKFWVKARSVEEVFVRNTYPLFFLGGILGLSWLVFGGGEPYLGIINEIYYSFLQAVGFVASASAPLNSPSVVLSSTLGLPSTLTNLFQRVLVVIGVSLMFFSKNGVLKALSIGTTILVAALSLLFLPGFSWGVNIGQVYLASSILMSVALAVVLERIGLANLHGAARRFTPNGKWIPMVLVAMFCVNGMLWPPALYSQTNKGMVMSYGGPMLYHVDPKMSAYYGYVEGHLLPGTQYRADDITGLYLGFLMNVTVTQLPQVSSMSEAHDLWFISSSYGLLVRDGHVLPIGNVETLAGPIVNVFFNDGNDTIQQLI